jgi:hypothetical protein
MQPTPTSTASPNSLPTSTPTSNPENPTANPDTTNPNLNPSSTLITPDSSSTSPTKQPPPNGKPTVDDASANLPQIALMTSLIVIALGLAIYFIKHKW